MEERGKRLLAVFAHPDDETYGPGGTIARYAIEGADVFLLTFTRGEAGTIGVSRKIPMRELGRRRKQELKAACEALGIVDHQVLEVPDRRVSGYPETKGVAAVLEAFEAYRPDVVITFHRLGVSGHPDHKAVTRFAREAFRRAGDRGPSKLYEWVIPASLAPSRPGREILTVADAEITTRIEIPPEAMDRKMLAIERHETQIEFFHLLTELYGDYREATSTEYFILADTRLPRPDTIETDLFEGIGE